MTETWTSGYVTDTVYTLGYHRELAPTHLDYACLINGVASPSAERPFRYCELGCGRGYSTTLLAAANPDSEFIGIDFIPAHIAEARDFAARAGIDNVRFLEMDFETAVRSNDPELASFDIVALHGVYAWVPAHVREDIHAFLSTKLCPGGIAFVSYNAMLGWNRIVPAQRLLIEVANRAGGNSLARAEAGMKLMRRLVDESDGMVERSGALAKKQVAHLESQDKHYLAHEYLNAAWQPLFVTDVISALAKAGLDYIGSANIAENRTEFCVPKGLFSVVRSAPDIGMRELLKDYVVGKQFRRDIYVKQPQALKPGDQHLRLLESTFAALPHVGSVPERLRVPVGALRPKPDVLTAIWERVRTGPASGADLRDAAIKAGERDDMVWPLVELLVNAGVLHPALPHASRAPAPSVSHRLNALIIEMSRSANTHGYLAVPALGSAIHANLPERIIAPLLGEEPDLDDLGIARKAFDRVRAGGQDFIKDGRPVERSEDNVQALAGFVREFRENRLPRWRSLGAVP